MYTLIIDNTIASYSKTKMEWWLYTESEWLCGGMEITECTNTNTQNSLWEDIYTICAVDPNQKEKEINEKIKRLQAINDEIIQLWGSNALTNYPKMNEIRLRKIDILEDEFAEIQTDLETNYEVTLVDDIIESLFG